MDNILPIVEKTYDEIYRDALKDVTDNTNVVVKNNISTANAFIEMISRQMASVYGDIRTTVENTYISTAAGAALDRIGDLFGLTRGSSTRPEALGLDTMQFSVNATSNITLSQLIALVPDAIITANPTTFPGGIGSNSFVIKKCVTVETDDGIGFYTVDDITISESSRSGFTGIIGFGVGEQYNVGEGSLKNHNIRNLQPELAEILDYLVCNNIQPVGGGSDRESDEDFRWRIVNRAVAAANANETSIRNAVTEVPGISDVVMLPQTNGVGTFTVFVQSTAPVIDQGTINAVEAAVNTVKAYGEKVYVTAPNYLAVQMNLELDFRPNANEEELLDRAVQTVVDYVNNTPLNGEIIINEIIERVMALDNNIRDMGISHFAVSPYDRTTGIIDETGTEFLTIANQKAGWNEKFFTSSSYCTICRAETR